MDNIDDYTGLTRDEDITKYSRLVQSSEDLSDIDFDASEYSEAFDSDVNDLEYADHPSELRSSIKAQVYRLNKELHLNINLDDPSKRRQRFILYMKLINEGGGYKEFAMLAAEYELLYVGFYMAHLKFNTIIRDIDKDDLEMEIIIAIIENLPKYDPSRGEPSTFFCRKIFDRLFVYINKIKFNRCERDARRIHQVARILSDFRKRGITPSVGDVSMELDLRYHIDEKISPDKIEYYINRALRPSQLSMDEHDYLHEIIPGSDEYNIDFSNPAQIAIHKDSFDQLINCIHRIANSESDALAFEEHYIHGKSVAKIAKEFFNGTRTQASIWRQFDSIKNRLKKDPEFISLYMEENRSTDHVGKTATINTDEALEQLQDSDLRAFLNDESI